MKKLAFTLSLITSISTFACSTPEAQFIGKVINYTNDCKFQIEFLHYSINVMCPLDQNEAEDTFFTDKYCSLKNGEAISGYLIKNELNEVVID